MKNPFEYRLIAKGEDFIDREEEIETIIRSTQAGQNITIYSPRRYGKSSLIMETFRRISNAKTVYLDLNKVNSISDLADSMISQTTKNTYSSVEKGFSFVKDTLLSLRPTFTPTEDGGVSISVKMVDEQQDLEKALQFPQKVAEKKNTDIIIAMDEFQRIRTLNGDKLQRLFRSIIQEQDRVTYIFSGSQVHMLKEMFESGDRPFFKSTKIMELERIPEESFKDYIIRGFESTDIDVKASLIDEILDFTEGHPMRTKELCFELWNKKRSGQTFESMNELLDIMIENDIYIEEVWNNITSAVQRRTLEAVANDENPYSQQTIKEYELKSNSHVQRSLKSLERKGILYKDDIVDPFLKEWIQRESR